MSRITLPENVLSFLESLPSKAELCDSTGRVVGVFAPAEEACADAPELPAGELERRRQSSKWFSTADVLARLKDQ
jgi:hypothetical protein